MEAASRLSFFRRAEALRFHRWNYDDVHTNVRPVG